MKIRNKVAIVTGASSGIGLATAKLLAQEGARVALVSRSREKLEEISKNLPDSFVVSADMSKEKDIVEMIGKVQKHFGRIDILVNNAGVGYDSPVEKINIETFRKVFDLDLLGIVVAMQEVTPIMRREGGGSIVNISSGTALMALPNMSAYSSLKRALVGISLTAREELSQDNIKVSVGYPYITDTNFEKNTFKNNVKEEMGEVSPAKADSPEYVGQKILDAIEKGEAEIFVHDWMRPK